MVLILKEKRKTEKKGRKGKESDHTIEGDPPQQIVNDKKNPLFLNGTAIRGTGFELHLLYSKGKI